MQLSVSDWHSLGEKKIIPIYRSTTRRSTQKFVNFLLRFNHCVSWFFFHKRAAYMCVQVQIERVQQSNNSPFSIIHGKRSWYCRTHNHTSLSHSSSKSDQNLWKSKTRYESKFRVVGQKNREYCVSLLSFLPPCYLNIFSSISVSDKVISDIT